MLKKIVIKLLSIIVLFTVATSFLNATAETHTSEGNVFKSGPLIYGNYEYVSVQISENGRISYEAYITGYNGSEVEVTIPERIGLYTVTAIEDGSMVDINGNFKSFSNNPYIEKVVFPSTIKRIGGQFTDDRNVIISNLMENKFGAFEGCVNLKEIVFEENDDGNSALETIGASSFGLCNLQEVVLPRNVVKIYGGAFYGNVNLKRIVLSEKMTELSDEYSSEYYSPFADCNNILQVCLGQEFYDEKVKFHFPKAEITGGKYVLENGVLFAPEYSELVSFSASKTDTTYSVPNGTLKIGAYAFYGANVEEIYLPASVISIDTCAFKYCSKLKAFEVNAENDYFCALDNVLYTRDLKSLIKFPENSDLTEYTLPPSVEVIEDNAIWSEKLSSVSIPKTIKSIGEKALGYYGDEIMKNLDEFSIAGYCKTASEKYAKGNYTNSEKWLFRFIDKCSQHQLLCGDVNGDGKISVADARAIVVAIAKGDLSLGKNNTKDYNKDGKLSVADARAIVVAIAKGSAK